jgi:putrescine transport system substrate-binding protein
MRISLLDIPQEVVPAALAYLGPDPKSRGLSDLDKRSPRSKRPRPYIRKFHSSQYSTISAMGICVSPLVIRATWCRRGTGHARPATG